jgi:long-chain acyl-CoA synthetase
VNLRLMLEKVARQYGTKTAVALGDQRLSYAELDEASNRVANALLEVGLSKGDRVAMLLSNSPEFTIIYFGIVKIGAIAVPLDTRYKLDELASLFNNSQPKILVAESPFLEPLVSALPRFKSIEHVIDLSSKYEGQFLSYREIIATSSARKVEVGLEAEDIALICYASGATSRPRGAILSHGSLIVEAEASGDGFEQTDKDIVMLFALPLYHVFGLEIVLLTSLLRGSTVVMLPGLSINSLMETIERERATIFMGVPYIFALAVNMAEKEGINHDLSSLRLCVSSAQALPMSIMKRFKQHYGFDIVQLWGLTEAVAHITCQSVDGAGKPGSVGKPLSGWEIKVVDDNGKELPTNQPGEIIVRGPFMKGYYANPEDTAEMIKDGWLYTGDIGKIDEDGELFILGLKKEMILVKGQNIYPIDIEAVLHSHPRVAEAAVVGIPDEIRGERIRGVVSLKDGQIATERELQDFCREHLANYKVPKQIIFVKSLPKTATGKIRKQELKQA